MFSRSTKIKIEMLKKGISQAEIGRRLWITRGAVCQVISGYSRSGRIRKAIAEALDIPYEELWGDDDEKNENDKEVA